MTTIDPWGSTLVEDYAKIIKDFGLETFDPSMFPAPNRIMRRGVVFAGRDLKRIAQCIKEKKEFYALTGIMPTGDKIHLGNKMVVENLRYFQDHGATTYILVADLEAAATREVTLEQARKRALEFHIPAYIALGLDPKKTLFYFQSENREVMHLAYEFSRKVTLNEFRAIYGQAEPSRIIGAITQVGDILYPQLKKRMPGIIPVGIDQDPHIRLSRDVVARTKSTYGFVPPSSIYHRFTPSLDGDLKMSKSKPQANVELPEEEKPLSKKLKATFTGGRDTVDEQRVKGGEPHKCIVFELYKQHFIEDERQLQEVYDGCVKGKLLCGEDKNNCVSLVTAFMKDFEQKLIEARKIVPKLNFVKF